MNPLGRLRESNPDLIEKIKKLEQRIKNLETNPRVGGASVDAGGFRINVNPDNQFEVYIDGTLRFKMASDDIRFLRPDGLTAFFLTEFAERYVVGFQDNSLHTVMGDDAITGFGLSRPFIPFPFYDDHQFAPARTTTSATYVNLQWSTYNVQHPFVFVTSLVRTSDGTTGGELILKINGNVVTSTTTAIPLGYNALLTQSINFAYHGGIAHGEDCELVVSARRTAGAGNIGVRTVHAYGRSTPL